MNSVEDLVAYIESRFPCVEGLSTHVCQTGDPYVVVSKGGMSDFVPHPSYGSEDEAIADAKRFFYAYAVDKSGTLYWRKSPRIERAGRKVRVYLRLVITDKPVIYPNLEAFDAGRSARMASERERAPVHEFRGDKGVWGRHWAEPDGGPNDPYVAFDRQQA